MPKKIKKKVLHEKVYVLEQLASNNMDDWELCCQLDTPLEDHLVISVPVDMPAYKVEQLYTALSDAEVNINKEIIIVSHNIAFMRTRLLSHNERIEDVTNKNNGDRSRTSVVRGSDAGCECGKGNECCSTGSDNDKTNGQETKDKS